MSADCPNTAKASFFDRPVVRAQLLPFILILYIEWKEVRDPYVFL